MREIQTHQIGALNKALRLEAIDATSEGGAPTMYTVFWKDLIGRTRKRDIIFQEGLFSRDGINGMTNEVLLAIVRDRLECFQLGPFPCEENVRALNFVTEAMYWLGVRTKDRISRAVEDTYNV
jgi:hypothetical protein